MSDEGFLLRLQSLFPFMVKGTLSKEAALLFSFLHSLLMRVKGKNLLPL